MTDCPVCGCSLPVPFLTRRNIPVHQNLVMRSLEAARDTPRGDLFLAHCSTCDFVTNYAFRQELVRYGENYDNNQVCSPTFESYVDGLVDDVAKRVHSGQQVIEVGCGNGYFLRKLVAKTGCSALGFDPSYRGPESESGGLIRFVTDYYGPNYADAPADLVICRHVIEHVADPLALLRSVRSALRSSPQASVVFETPAVEWILDGCVYQDFFYEHCSYFSHASLPLAFARAGFNVVRVARVFGGQYLWVEARLADDSEGRATNRSLGPAVATYVEEERHRLAAAREMIDSLSAGGGIAVWGAGAKGVTFLNLVDPAAMLVSCAVDINPTKQGGFVPGTGHPIVDLAQLRVLRTQHVLVMNPNYLQEAKNMATDQGIDVEFHLDHPQ